MTSRRLSLMLEPNTVYTVHLSKRDTPYVLNTSLRTNDEGEFEVDENVTVELLPLVWPHA